MANAIPALEPVSCWPLSESAVHKLTIPKNGANLGVNSASAMMGKLYCLVKRGSGGVEFKVVVSGRRR